VSRSNEHQSGQYPSVDLTALIYDGINESPPWQSLVNQVRRQLGAKGVFVTLHHSPRLMGDVHVSAVAPGDTVDWVEVERVCRAYLAGEATLYSAQQAGSEGSLIASSDFLGPEGLAYIRSLGIKGTFRARFSDPAGVMSCWVDIVLGTGNTSARFERQAKELLEQVLPHLERALGLYVQLQQCMLERSIFENSLDHMHLGCILLDDEARIISLNRAALRVIEGYDRVRITDRLVFTDPLTQSELKHALECALQARRQAACLESDSGKSLLSVSSPGQGFLGVLVAPTVLEPTFQGRRVPSVIVYIAEFGGLWVGEMSDADKACAAISQLFGLTPQEGRLAMQLAAGCSLADAAERLQVAVSAARNYSKNIYAKLGIRGQSDLIRLVFRSFPLLQ